MIRELKKLIAIISIVPIMFTTIPATALYANESVIFNDDAFQADALNIFESVDESVQVEDSKLEEVIQNEENYAIGEDDTLSNGKVSIKEEEDLRELSGIIYDADSNKIAVEVNQGFAYHLVTTADGGIINATAENTKDIPMNDFSAHKPTAIMVRLPGVESVEKAMEKLNGYTIAITYANSRNILLEANCSNFSYQMYSNHDGDTAGCMAIFRLADGFAQNSFNIYLRNPSKKTITGRSKVNFYQTKKLRILLVPCITYYSSSGWAEHHLPQQCPTDRLNTPVECDPALLEGLDKKIYNYLMDVYPHSDIEIQWGATGNFGTKQYDLADPDNGWWEIWNGLRNLQPMAGSGVEQYDKILGFVQYRQGPTSGTLGYTCGAPANIITLSDEDMLATVAHEMAHNYDIGDEYDNEVSSSLNPNINPVPYGFKGTHIVTRDPVVSSAPYFIATSPVQLNNGEGVSNPDIFADKVELADGAVLFPNMHPYSFYKDKMLDFIYFDNGRIQPIISFMGTGYTNPDYYFSSPYIWDHLLKESLVKGSVTYSRESEKVSAAAENLSIIENADNTIFTAEDVIDPSYREGNSSLIEIKGKILYNSTSSNAIPIEDPVKLDVPYSYSGNLSEISEDMSRLDSKNSDYDMYVFAALDKDGNIIKSPVDGKEAKHVFYAGNYNVVSCSHSGRSNYNNYGTFSFVAEYPDGTDKFVIYPETKPTEILKEIKVPSTTPNGVVVYSDINANKAKVDWIVDEIDLNTNEVLNGKEDDLHVEVYYAPEGNNGGLYPIKEGKNKEFPGKDNYGLVEGANWSTIEFDTSKYGWTSDAYVLVAISNGVNADYLYSNENDITLGNDNTIITINGGKRGTDNFKHFTYTGDEITPTVSVKVFDAEAGRYINLINDVDYMLQYSNNINAGDAKVTAIGLGSYAGTISGKFIIDKAPIKNAKLSTMTDLVYDGTIDDSIWGNDKCNTLLDIENNMIVRLQNKELYLDSDYTVTYNDNEELPIPKDEAIQITVKIKGVENYTGEVTVRKAFILYPASLAKGIISANSIINWDKNKTYNYTGSEIKPSVKSVYVNGEKLNPKYYKVTYSNNIKTGIGNINVVGKNGYVGYASITFNIGKMKVSGLNVKGVSNIVYSGQVVGTEALLPIKVYAGKVKLTENKDYIVKYNGVLNKPSDGLKGSDRPSVTVTLKDDSKIVEWSRPEWKGGAKKVVKQFTIKKAPFNTKSLVTVNLDSISENGLTHYFSKNTDAKSIKKYFYILKSCDVDKDGTNDGIKGTITDENINMKLYIKGKELDRSKYTVEIKIPKFLNKVGRVIIKPKDTTYYSGNRTILFLLE